MRRRDVVKRWSRKAFARENRVRRKARLGHSDVYGLLALILDEIQTNREECGPFLAKHLASYVPRNNSRTTNATAPRCEVRP